jgi:hypothetical protein
LDLDFFFVSVSVWYLVWVLILDLGLFCFFID